MLNRLAVRLCAVYALMDNTFAEDGVRDSQITMIDAKSNLDDTRPFIAVYTDDQSDKQLTLTFEIGVTARMTTVDGSGNNVIVPGIPPTDAGIEMVLDLIERQIHVALADESNEWAELLRFCFSDVGGSKSIRGASKTSDGERYAGRQIVIDGTVLADPEYGRALSVDGFWELFLTKAEAEPNLVAIASSIRALLGNGDPVDWKTMQRAMSLTRTAADRLGISPQIGEIATPITAVEVEDDTPGAGA